MNVRIFPRPLSGTVMAPASKSEAHRLLICAALADHPTRVHLNTSSEDIEATLGCLRALGAGIEQIDEGLEITPIDIQNIPDNPLLDCHESGSTLRFMLPVAAALCGRASFTGSGRLPDRPIGELLEEMGRHGVRSSSNNLPLEIDGRLSPGDYCLPGNVSSQYITGLLMALALLDGDSRLTLTSPLQSAAYVDITLAALARFKINCKVRSDAQGHPIGYEVLKSSFHSPGTMAVGGDWSNAAFFLAAGALGDSVSVTGLDTDSPQGDKKIVELLRGFGAKVDVRENEVVASPGVLHAQSIDIDPTPDLLPILAVIASCSDGVTTFFNGARLRLKESDRIAASAAMIRALGGTVQELSDKLIVTGTPLSGGEADGFHDHRIVMAVSIAAARCSSNVIIRGAEAVNKSYPDFFKDYGTLGGEVHVL
ncbi:MAG: 3-phosphoshikimate 1-carboxyvinyltransferase [Fretibacterium sp.]|nr:3-phosphoshikimate 1-carboxyvinyltransferase [Fretibacterium sp.]